MKKILLATLLAGLSASASANGFYGIAGGGLSFYEDGGRDATELNSLLVDTVGYSSAVTEYDSATFGFKLGGGYKINEKVGIEVSYLNFGKTTFDVTTTGPTETGAIDLEANAFNFSVAGFFPISERVEFVGRIGMARWDLDLTGSGTLFSGATFSDSGTSLSYGVGVGIKFGETFTMAIDADRTEIKDRDNDKFPFTLITVGGRFAF